MKCLSFRPPWSELIVAGIKLIENRTWKYVPDQPSQWLAIHASQKADPGCDKFLREGYSIEAFSLGAIIGAAYWCGSYSPKTLPKQYRDDEFRDRDSTVYLIFSDAVRIEPVKCKGKLGFWQAPEEAEARILREIKRCSR